ncbi:MAG: type II secretion system protein [Polyangiales bacterium]
MKQRGFTLLEVMIAVAILGLSLTAIFSSEVGAANVAARARRQNAAATLARCKMGEIEELIAVEGLPALEKKDKDACCEHAPVEGFECEWIVERIILPEFGVGAEDEDDEDESANNPRDIVDDAVDQVSGSDAPTEQALAGQAGNLAMLALQIGFPILKPFLEEQVRRATVSVRWKEGPKERGFDVVQYLVSDQPAPTDETVLEEEE